MTKAVNEEEKFTIMNSTHDLKTILRSIQRELNYYEARILEHVAATESKKPSVLS